MKTKKSNAKTLSAKQMKKVKGSGLRAAASINPNASMISTGVSGQASGGLTAPLPPTAVR
jgi:hypothetical protein